VASGTGDQPATKSEQVGWGLGDAAIGFSLAWVLTLVLTPLIFAITGVDTDTKAADVPLRTIALQQVPFDGAMLGVALYASFRKGRGPVRDFGWRFEWRDLLGLVVGVATQYAAFLLYLPLFWLTSIDMDEVSEPARNLTDKASGGGVVLLVLIVVIAAPIVEELFFRGLVMRSLEQRYGTRWAIVGSAAIFGAAHLEPLQFPALFLFGLVAAVLVTRTGRLGPATFAHVAFNGIAVLSLLT
jgi:membrane protease YdiL (CAAX protease family)